METIYLPTVPLQYLYQGQYGYVCKTASKKVKLSLYRPWRSLGLREVEAPTFSDIRFTDKGKVVSPKRRPLFTPRKIPGTHFC
jgi:hypothetical protein